MHGLVLVSTLVCNIFRRAFQNCRVGIKAHHRCSLSPWRTKTVWIITLQADCFAFQKQSQPPAIVYDRLQTFPFWICLSRVTCSFSVPSLVLKTSPVASMASFAQGSIAMIWQASWLLPFAEDRKSKIWNVGFGP